MSSEKWAGQIIQRELKQTVELNDDGSMDGMYDLRIGNPEAPEIAIEVVGAVDETITETWNVGPARGPLHLPIGGDWDVVIRSGTSIKLLKKKLGQVLQELERLGVQEVRYGEKKRLSLHHIPFEKLGILDAFCFRRNGTGKVQLGLPGIDGAIDRYGKKFPDWIGEFLRDCANSDVIKKLKRSGATQCHVFVIVTFGGAPPSTEGYLMRDLTYLPTDQPDLPDPVTGIWTVSEVGFGDNRGIRWDGTTWRRFKK